MTEIKNFVNGQFVSGSGAQKSIYSPWDGTIIGCYHESTSGDLEASIEQIKLAQQQWSHLTVRKRAQVFYRYRSIVKRELPELIKINSQENGKLESEALGGWNKALEIIEYAIAMPHLVKTRMVSNVSTGINAYENKRPLGIVASITPFNFPAMVPHWTIPITLMAGNAIVLKPSELTPISASKIASMLQEAGLPDGLFSIFNGGKEIVEALLEQKDIKAITFVGSSQVAKLVYTKAAQNLKRVLALGEAKNHILVTNDTNPKIVASNIVASAFGMSGQRCMAASVVVTIGGFHFQNEIVGILKQQVMGKDYGAIISPANLQKIYDYITYAERVGASILVDGRTVPKYNTSGYWIGQTIIDWGHHKEKLKQFEVFGPVLEIVHARDIKEAIAIQNTSPYGNGASIFTQNGRYAQLATNGLQAGMIGVNIGVPVPREPLAFGGIKNSLFGHGNITGSELIDFVTYNIKVTEKWNAETQEDWMS